MKLIIKVNGFCYSNPKSVIKYHSTKSITYFARPYNLGNEIDHSMLLLWN